MATLVRGQTALRSHFRPQSHNLSALHPHPSVCYLQLFSTTSANHQSNNKPTPTTPTIVTTPSKQEINAPLSTFPAEIETPPQNSPSASTTDKIKRIIATGRAYLTFYKTGLKNVFRNYRASLPLRKTLGLPAYLPVSPPRKVSSSSRDNVAKATATQLGRGQFQLVRRSARDVRRMIPFTLILLICGEFTPLIIPIFGSAITPATCRVPSQIAKERESASKRKYLALTAHAHASQQNPPSASPVSVGSKEEVELLASFADADWVLGKANADAVLRASAVFGLVKSHERKFGGGFLVGSVYRPRLRKYVEYLAIDDEMIRRAGVKALSVEEVRFALDERGLGDVGSLVPRGKKVESVERVALERWLEARKM